MWTVGVTSGAGFCAISADENEGHRPGTNEVRGSAQ